MVGPWKLTVIRDYISSYTVCMRARNQQLRLTYHHVIMSISFTRMHMHLRTRRATMIVVLLAKPFSMMYDVSPTKCVFYILLNPSMRPSNYEVCGISYNMKAPVHVNAQMLPNSLYAALIAGENVERIRW